MEKKIGISVVVPVMNEEESIPPFFKALMEVLPTLDKKYEVIFIDDGSTDASLSLLQELEKKHSYVHVYSFRRNLGKSDALMYGFMKAEGDLIFTLDADLQDKPSEMPKLLSKIHEGAEVVTGWKEDRKDKSYMVLISRLFNGVVNKMFNMHIHDYNCGFKLYVSEAAKSLRLYGGLYRFIPLLVAKQGFKVAEVPVEHAPRKFGKSKYGFSKLWKNIPDMFTMLFLVKFNKRPLHFFGVIGGAFLLIGTIMLGYLSILHFFGESINRRPLLIFGMLFMISGFQIFFTGFLADLMIHISEENNMLTLDKKQYPIKYSSKNS
jgi:glycosyltransferase involved in cell wall biosynthesis